MKKLSEFEFEEELNKKYFEQRYMEMDEILKRMHDEKIDLNEGLDLVHEILKDMWDHESIVIGAKFLKHLRTYWFEPEQRYETCAMLRDMYRKRKRIDNIAKKL